MFDKLLGKKEKGIQVFNLPEKKYCHDAKKLAKMEKKDLNQVIGDMEKYIGNLSEKLELGKKEYEKALERSEELLEKTNVLNGEMSKISNEHEELQVKFSNLQNSLEMMIQDRETSLKSEIKYIEEHALTKERIKDFSKVFEIYRGQVAISDKISHQNRQLKQKLTTIEGEYHQLSEKYNETKSKMLASIDLLQPAHEDSTQVDKSVEAFCGECPKLQSLLQGKEQIIVSLNKQISTERSKLQQNSDQIEQLNSDLEQILKKVETKDEQLLRSKQQNMELTNTLNAIKRNELKIKQNEDRLKEELNGARNSLISYESQIAGLKEKLGAAEQTGKQAAGELDRLKSEVEKKDNELENIRQKLKSYEQELVSLSKLSVEFNQKETELNSLRGELDRQKNKNEQAKKSMQVLQQDYQLKLKKSQIATNQQRIKCEALKRSVTNLQTQQQQNRKNLDSMYENKIQQDGKILQMQKKLKEYKHLIQYLKKEKIELEKTFQNKIKNMEEMVLEDEEDDGREGQMKVLAASKDLSCASPSPRYEPMEEYEKEAIVLQKRIAELEEQIDMLKEENMGLKMEKGQLEQQNGDLSANLKSLTLKREQAMREIKKMSSIKTIDIGQNKLAQRKHSEQIKQKQKRVAEKAYKGFDILAKLMSTLYKQFITVHVNEIERKEIKQIQSSINSIVRKSLDMKDIFQDYI